MSDDVRWVVQRASGEFWTHTVHGGSGENWREQLSDQTVKYGSEIEAHRVWSRGGACHPFYVRAVRRVPGKRRWEQRADPAGGNLRLPYVHCKGAHYEVVELPLEPSDRWELVPDGERGNE